MTSSNTSLLYTGSSAGEFVVWDKTTWTRIAEDLTMYDEFKWMLVDEIYVYGGGYLGYLHRWNKETREFDHKSLRQPLSTAAIDDRYLYWTEDQLFRSWAQRDNYVIHVWDKYNLRSVNTIITNQKFIQHLINDGDILISISSNDQICRWKKVDWSCETRQQLEPYFLCDDAVTDDRFLYCSHFLSSNITVFEKQTLRLNCTIETSHGCPRLFVDTKYIYAGMSNGEILILSKEPFRILHTIPFPVSDTQKAITAIYSDTEYIYAGYHHGGFNVWDKNSFQFIRNIEYPLEIDVIAGDSKDNSTVDSKHKML